jgi:hypothetical protein
MILKGFTGIHDMGPTDGFTSLQEEVRTTDFYHP